MLEWIRKKPKASPAEVAQTSPFTELVDFLLNQLPEPEFAPPLLERVRRFKSLAVEEQERELPATYLFLEQYLVDSGGALADAGGVRLDTTQLRSLVVTAHDGLLSLPGFRLIFEPPELQQIFLCRELLSMLLERSSDVLGTAGDGDLRETLEWLSEIPDRAADPIPFDVETEQPQSTEDWIQLLTLMTRALYDRVERVLGRQAARRIFERAYRDLAARFLGLSTFSVVIGLLPEKLLDEHKIRELNRGQMRQVVLDKVEHLQRANERLQENNRQLARARQALEEANEELEERVRDRTEALRKVNETLRENEETLSLITASAYDAIVMIDDRGLVSFWNTAAERVFGYPRSYMLGQDVCRVLVPRRFRARFQQALRHFSQTGEGPAVGETIEWSAVGRNREEFPIELSLSAVKIQDRWHALGLVRDITERKQAEEERRQLEERMQQNQRLESLGLLAGGIAHDFNNLLSTILGNAGLAKHKVAVSDAVLSNLDDIENAAARAADLTQQMLAYSGRGQFIIEACDLSRLVEEMAQLLGISISKRADLRCDLDHALPAIEADRAQLQQVVMNLIINASDALGEEDGTITARTGVIEVDRDFLAACELGEELEAGRYVLVEVSDTGCGMAEETRAKIFDPFFSTKFVGRGLGLAAVLGIVRGHSGALSVTSRLGVGSTFRVLFPPSPATTGQAAVGREASSATDGVAVAAGAVAAGDAAPGNRAAGLDSHDESGTVLVVDDEPAVRGMVSSALEILGFQVFAAGDGQQAVDVFRQHAGEIDLVLMDMTMPKMDGREAFLKIRDLRADARVILSSGYSQQDALRDLHGERPMGFLQKPYDLTALASEVRSVLAS